MPWWGWMLIVIAILVVILVVLYIVGNRLQKKQSAQKEAMLQAAQPVTMLVIDKKMLPMKDANLPKQVLESTPKRYQKAKLPIVKAKIGPQIINLICDDGIFDVMPVRGEVKAKLFEFQIPAGEAEDETYPVSYYARFPVKQFTDKTLILRGDLRKAFFDGIRNEDSHLNDIIRCRLLCFVFEFFDFRIRDSLHFITCFCPCKPCGFPAKLVNCFVFSGKMYLV